MSVNYGSKRIVVGAHYGMRDWLAQRVTAAIMALFTLLLLAQVLFTKGPIGYDKWAGIFSSQWMKVLTFTVIVALLYHVWVGMRDIWMDYVKPVGIRLGLQVFTMVWLLACAGWGIQVLWRV
ncbi:MAG: succinate dehydrogenase subunit [Polaromonas sp.]|nr:succinate dehydrogenase subunit [Polaromonas sp.]